MADNFTANSGSGGETFASDDIGGIQYPRSKIVIGADNTNDGDISAANPMPVTGTITAVTDITNAITVNAHAVTNAGTFAVQVDGDALTALQLIDDPVATISSTPLMRVAIYDASDSQITSFGGGTQHAVDDALGATPTGTLSIAIRDDALSALTPVEGDAVGLRVDANGGLWTQEVNSAAILADTASMDTNLGTLAGAVTGTEMQVDIVSGNVTNAGTFAVQVDGDALTALQLIDDAVYVDDADWSDGVSKHILIGGLYQSVEQSITDGDVGPLSVDSNGRLKISIEADNAGIGGGTQYTEDAAAAADPVGNAQILIRTDTPATVTSTDGDNVAQRGTNYGAAYVQVVDSAGNYIDTFGGSGGTAAADDADFVAGTTQGTPAMGVYESTPSTVTDGDVGIVGIDTNRNLKVSIEADSVGIGGGTQYTEDAAAASDPVGNAMIVVRDDNITSQVDTDGDNVAVRGSPYGALYTAPGNFISTNNSTTSTLGISGVYTGTGDDVSQFTSITIQLDSSHDSAASGMTFQFSIDNTNWDDVYSFTYTAADGARRFQFPVTAQYFRIVYTNGGTGQTHFRVQTILHTENQLYSVHRLGDNTSADRSSQVVKAALLAQINGSGDFTPVASSSAGDLRVSLEDQPVTNTEDNASGNGNGGIPALVVRDDTLAANAEVNADGDYTWLRVDNNGALWVNQNGTVTVDNAGTFATQVDGDALTALQLIDDAVHADDAAFTLGTHKGVMMMGFAGTQSVDANDAAALACDTDGALHVSDGGNTLTVDGTVAATQSGTWNITNVSGTVSLPTGAATQATLADVETNTDFGAVTGGGVEATALRVTIASDSTGTLTVDNAGTFATQVDGDALTALQLIDDPVFADDAAFTIATSKVMVAGGVVDDTSTDSADEGDAAAIRLTPDRKQVVHMQPHTTGGVSISRDIDLDNGTLTVVKASAGLLYGMTITNTSTATVFVKFYDAASGTLGTGTPVLTIGIPGNSTDDTLFSETFPIGVEFATGICVGAGTGVADADNTDPGANAVVANIFYK